MKPSSHTPACMKSQTGMSIVELMVAILISMILLAGVIQVYISSKQSYRINDETARIQESIRFSSSYLNKDIRMAGYLGCYSESTRLANTLNNGSTSWIIDISTPLRGYEGGVSTFPSEISGALSGTDAIVVLRGDTDDQYVVSKHNANAASIHLTANHNLKKGEILLITDCEQASLFQQTNTNNNNTISVVDHNTGNTVTPGNCTKSLGSLVPYSDCTDTSQTFKYSFGGDAALMRLSSSAYYIANNGNGVPSLYRRKLVNGTSTTTTLTTTAEELVEGIENMQIEYGVDTDATKDGIPNRYATANVIDSTYDWADVTSVRIHLLARSGAQASPTVQAAFSYNNATYTPTDKYIRRVVSTTIKVRNRGDR